MSMQGRQDDEPLDFQDPTLRVSLKSALVRGDQVRIEVTGSPDDFADARLMLHVVDKGGTARELPVLLDSSGVGAIDLDVLAGAASTVPVLIVNGRSINLSFDNKNYSVGTLICSDVKSVLSTIRWNGRVEDYETRKFICYNSLPQFSENFRLSVYCLLSFGYSAIERNDVETCNDIFQRCSHLISWKYKDSDVAPFVSLLTLYWHLAVLRENLSALLSAADHIIDSLPKLRFDATATWNSAITLLGAANVLMVSGHGWDALKYLIPIDQIYRIAAELYPRHPKAFGEIAFVHKLAQLALTGCYVARGEALPPETSYPSYPEVFGMCLRLREPTSKVKLTGIMQDLARGQLVVAGGSAVEDVNRGGEAMDISSMCKEFGTRFRLSKIGTRGYSALQIDDMVEYSAGDGRGQLSEYGIQVNVGADNSNRILISRSMPKCSLSINFGKRTGNLILLEKPRQLSGNIIFHGDENICALGSGWLTVKVEFDAKGALLYLSRNSSSGGTTFWIQGEGTSILVGEDCMFAWGIGVRNGDAHGVIDVNTLEVTNKPANVIIHPHVWLAQDVLVFKGVEIGAGTVLSARSVVTKSLPAQVAAAGSPAAVRREGVTWTRRAEPVDHEKVFFSKMKFL